ncbi:unnamed protein product [Schistosoma margrebowiei]|uniref:Snake toxin/toxin-like domain-containing protein n=1 Tax=Schistosoma margrebowiei TaxID=48269 RepID=A0AA84ZTA0_9TREM|nr:unnamed protein product [Schistosoma margrebowiei]
MKLIFFISHILISSIWIYSVESIQCYTCDQCSLPLQLEHLEVADGCKFCKTIEHSRYFLGGIATRQCVQHCKPLSNWLYWSYKSVQFTVNCCNKDLCNTSNFKSINMYLLLICPLLWQYFIDFL